MNRLKREALTIKAMIRLYCAGQAHSDPARPSLGKGQVAPSAKGLCPDCNALLGYALARLERCTFGALKPACAKCAVHCYRPDMRERARSMMRWAGPRMLLRHPWLALLHLYDGARSEARQVEYRRLAGRKETV